MSLRSILCAVLIATGGSLPAMAVPSALGDDRAQLLGDYLSGRYALQLNDARAQSSFFQSAYKAAPDDPRVARLALYSALSSGDRSLAKKTAESLYKSNDQESLARAILAVDAFSKGRSARVRKFTSRPTSDPTMGPVLKIVAGWNAVDEGRYERARTIFGDMGDVRYFQELGRLQIAKLEARLGNDEAARAAFDRVEESGVSPLEYGLSRARFDAASGDVEAALERLEAMAERSPRSRIATVGTYIDRLERGRSLPKLSEKAQAARALTDPSFAFYVRSGANDAAETVLRLARWVEPDFDRSAIWLAGLLEEIHDPVSGAVRDDILALYESVGRKSPYYVDARLGEANLLFGLDEDDVAIAVLEKAAEERPSYYTREALGRARFFREKWAEALPFYTQLVEGLTEEELQADPGPLRLRGIIYERLDRWSEAEVDFQRVLAYQPDDSDTLNYLGYTWVDRGENLEEAFDLIERALELEPDSGAITDSLGWAHYKLGRFDEALRYLEDAVVLTPYSATIIDHLGDAYWQVGRKREATFQWQRALEYDPTDEERETIQTKLAAGLDATPAQ